MHTMDNRIEVDEHTLEQFESDDNLSKTVKKFQEKKRRLEKTQA